MHSPLELLFIIALVLYSTVIWSHRFTGGALRPWMTWTFGTALACDASATVFLCGFGRIQWVWTVHTVSGLLALVIMALHFIWAVISVMKGGNAADRFHRFSVWAWLLWLVSFISGIPT